MGEDAESPKINHTFLRDYVTEGRRDGVPSQSVWCQITCWSWLNEFISASWVHYPRTAEYREWMLTLITPWFTEHPLFFILYSPMMDKCLIYCLESKEQKTAALIFGVYLLVLLRIYPCYAQASWVKVILALVNRLLWIDPAFSFPPPSTFPIVSWILCPPFSPFPLNFLSALSSLYLFHPYILVLTIILLNRLIFCRHPPSWCHLYSGV